MEILLDSADLQEIETYSVFLSGVTTNPSILSKYRDTDPSVRLKRICELVNGSVSAEVISNEYDQMLEEGRRLASISDNICVKLPCTFDGFKTCEKLSNEGIATNMTLCFSLPQALLAANSGATYISPFVGRLDDIGQDGLALLDDIVELYRVNQYETHVLAASIRHMQHIVQAALIGVDAITLPPQLLKQMFLHPLTTTGLEIFQRDWQKK